MSDTIILQVGDRYNFEFLGRRNDIALFAILGNALAAVQSFEVSIVGHLRPLSKNKSSGNQTANDDVDHFYSRTLGALIKQFQKHLPDSGVASLLENVREQRNYLIHHILKVYGWPLMSDEDYVHAIKEIDGIRDLMEKANIEVSRYLVNHSMADLVVFSIDHESGEITQIV